MKLLKLSVLLLTLLVVACANENNANKPTANQEGMATSAEKSTTDLQQQDQQEANNINFAENSTVYFDFDISNPKTNEVEKIINQAKWLKANNFKLVTIEGYTDIYGTREYNLALGERRANSIKELLVRNGIDPKKIKVVSYGKERLADQNTQWKNRRTITKVER